MGSKYKKSIVKEKVKRAYKKKSCKDIIPAVEKEFQDIKYRFKNNTEKWMTIILNENCVLLESYKAIGNEIEDLFGEDAIYFIPVYIEKENNADIGFQLFDGYIFVKCSEAANKESFKKTEHLDKILYRGSDPYSATNRDINKFKTKMKLDLIKRIPKKGSKIIAKEGTFKNQEGTVLSVNTRKKTAIIEFRKRTRIVTAKLSVINFELKSDS
jgi:transcription antitermination factor NusG